MSAPSSARSPGEPMPSRSAGGTGPDLATGRLTYAGAPELREEALALVRAHAGDGRSRCLRVAFAGGPAWFKGSAYRGKARWRHALRGALLRAAAPRLAEHANLTWLRAHGFGAPEPLAAGLFARGPLPGYQFLVTRHVPDAVTLRERLADDSDRAARERLVDALAREIARMHELGFRHRDLFPRNVLVGGTAERPELVFLDAWRGGPGPGLRSYDHDLACLLLHGVARLSPAEQARLLGRYLRGRGVTEPGREERFLTRVRRARARLVRRWHRTGGRPDLEPPPAEWTPPALRDASGSGREPV